MSILDGFLGLSKNKNKVEQTDAELQGEGVASALLNELELGMEDDELVALATEWEANWLPFENQLDKDRTDAENYWMGKHYTVAPSDEHPLVDNLIFESLETFLPIATRPKAEPLVEGDGTPDATEIAQIVRKMLAYQADRLSLNMKMKQTVRNWSLYRLGCIKFGFNLSENDIEISVIRPQKLIMDPDGYICEGEYYGDCLGERRRDKASTLIERFPEKAEAIRAMCHGKLGTKVNYVEWWTPEYLFWKMGDTILSKSKNPHWNYDREEAQTKVDDYGMETEEMVQVPGANHFNAPKIPYLFLSIFNLGKHPVDDTSLIKQNLPLQDLVNKRLGQIDKNADSANGGIVVSGDAFTQEQATQVSKAIRKGGTLWVPNGDVNKAYKRDTAQALPNYVYDQLVDVRNEIRNIFGTRGSTPQGTVGESTVRGKLIIKGQDTDRIGGGISTYLEELSDKAFNWMVQLFYVYYDQEHVAAVLGKDKATEYIRLKNEQLFGKKLTIGVKEGSMIPHDPVSQRNEAVDLWSTKAIDPITFFERLDFPNPREAAKQLYLWQADPIRLFPDLLQEQQAAQMAATPEPAPEMPMEQPMPTMPEMMPAGGPEGMMPDDLSQVPIE